MTNVSGGVIVLIGMAVLILGGFVIALDEITSVVGLGLCFFGFLRLGRQFHAERAYRRKHTVDCSK